LLVEGQLPDTQFARDLVVSMERGDISQMSFAWITKRDEWTQTKTGKPKRRLLEAEEVFDVSVVTYPAYNQTDISVAQRSLQRWQGIQPAYVGTLHYSLQAKADYEGRARELMLAKLRSGYVDWQEVEYDPDAQGQGIARSLAIARLRQSLHDDL